MNKKVVITIVIVCVVIVCVCLGIILVNSGDNQIEVEQGQAQKEVTNENNIETNEKKEVQEEKGESIVLESKIGSEILAKFVMPNIYSNLMYDELDNSGISNNFKIMYTFSLITNYQEYSHYLREAEDYTGSYITNDDLQKVANTLFDEASNLQHKDIFEENTYDEETEDYVIVARGFAGSDLDYIVEVPYDIIEYSEKVEVKTYRIYLKRKYDMESDENLPVEQVYYDKDMTSLATNISDEKMLDEIDGQKELLKSKIEEGIISKESLQISTWTLVKKGDDYLISDYTLEK